MTREEILRHLPNSSPTFLALNASEPVVGLQTQKPELRRRGKEKTMGVESQPICPAFRVVLTVFRKRLLDDHDNARMALKPLADHLTRMLGLKDDRKIEWHYAQVKSPTEGTHVLITLL